ncbi:hypothetical protein [Ralstonia solanacearum]|uniref:hypothetical protein n=1 Tax=Ralstonia solanacearum TaxID=305 RepID=UPI00236668B7|nr:hypothetical protein [Ralstonia solanacearum]MDD7803742.1 hypothetical protein [Ralstonia solanacearum]
MPYAPSSITIDSPDKADGMLIFDATPVRSRNQWKPRSTTMLETLLSMSRDLEHGAYVITDNEDGWFQRAGFTTERLISLQAASRSLRGTRLSAKLPPANSDPMDIHMKRRRLRFEAWWLQVERPVIVDLTT